MPLSAVADEPTIVCEVPVEFEYRDGLVYAFDPALRCLRAFRLHTFYASFHNAARCMQRCQLPAAGAEIIEFPVSPALHG